MGCSYKLQISPLIILREIIMPGYSFFSKPESNPTDKEKLVFITTCAAVALAMNMSIEYYNTGSLSLHGAFEWFEDPAHDIFAKSLTGAFLGGVVAAFSFFNQEEPTAEHLKKPSLLP